MLKHVLTLCLLALSASVYAGKADTQVEAILKQNTPPDGVVFEIVTGNDAGLEWALPRAKTYIEKLRQRFPELHVAVVTHGREQFALQKKQSQQQTKVHQLTQLLVQDNVPVHVCGTYAGWKGLSAEDFPAYVDVAAAGPAQINDYVNLGYIKIVLDKKEK